jgi:hypothetical protein
LAVYCVDGLVLSLARNPGTVTGSQKGFDPRRQVICVGQYLFGECASRTSLRKSS